MPDYANGWRKNAGRGFQKKAEFYVTQNLHDMPVFQEWMDSKHIRNMFVSSGDQLREITLKGTKPLRSKGFQMVRLQIGHNADVSEKEMM
ncbi:hypothetical protein NPIL_586071 [Nephila pilipes]|uniref:Uncharacterized protein n=1 Tax=Nephila pilipes TaxID=299642 RepID=A0A8X6P8R2_NEPPI|nr:hypothetical protein NPIL_586071 [Nephila pilipes]